MMAFNEDLGFDDSSVYKPAGSQDLNPATNDGSNTANSPYAGWEEDVANKFPGFDYNSATGTYTRTQEDGSTVQINSNGNLIGTTGDTYGTAGAGTDASLLNKIADGLPTQAWNALKGAFTKKDANGNDVTDWKALAAAGGGIAGLATNLMNKNNPPPIVGYQGKVPQLDAVQRQVAGTNDPNRRPGSSGQRYFTNLQYVNPANSAAAQTAANEQAIGIAGLNASNPSLQQRPVAIAPSAAPTAAAPASSVINQLAPTAEGLAAVRTMASGGITALKGGNYLAGPTDGMADKLPANIEGNQEARLSHGEFVIPADVVSHLGNGNSEAGADRLYSMMDKIRKARTGTKKQGKQINPDKFLPGGSVGYAKGGIAGFAGPDGSLVPTTTADPNNVIGKESNLSNWAGEYVTGMLGKGQALANQPYQGYSGPLTAGESAGQTSAFNASAGLNVPTDKMGAFTPQTFTATQAQNYMNPYLSAALTPQMEEMRRQSQLNLQPNMAKLTQAGGYGGSRQALLQSEANRNLQTQQNAELGKGYQTAFDKAMGQFNTEQGQGLAAQSANNAYGLQALQKQADLGASQRDIEQQGITADRAQFEEEKQDPYKKLQFQQSLLSGLPVAAQSNTYQQPSALTSLLGGANTINSLYNTLFPAAKA
jgi:hypothetical protein